MFSRTLHPGIHLWMIFLWLPLAVQASGKNYSNPDAEDGGRDTPSGCHRVLRGETLWGIAVKYNTSVGEIMEANHLDSQKLKEGRFLKIPSLYNGGSAAESRHYYFVKEDDTLRTIVKKLHTTTDDLANANPRLDVHRMSPGVKLTVPGCVDHEDRPRHTERVERLDEPPPVEHVKRKDSHRDEYVIHGDDTFSSIARHYGVKVEDILAANPDVKPERLHEGMIVWVPLKGHSSDYAEAYHHHHEPAPDDEIATPKRVKRTFVENTEKSHYADADRMADAPRPDAARGEETSYTVRAGDTFEIIAKRYGVSVHRLQTANKELSANPRLRPGDEITIPARRPVVTASR